MLKTEDLQAENSIIIRKNQIIVRELDEMREKQDALVRNIQRLEKFIPIFNSLREKFPEENIQDILTQYDKIEAYCLTGLKRIDDLEEEKKILQEERISAIKDLQTKKYELRDTEVERNKSVILFRSELDHKNGLIDKQKQFKDEYNSLFNKIVQLYAKWKDKMKIFVNGEVKSDLKDPLEIIDIIGKMMDISTPEEYQERYRKVIVSANQLLKKCIPGENKDRFDPDIIYDKVSKFIESLKNENKRLKNNLEITKKPNASGLK